jgi:hypothetical protein
MLYIYQISDRKLWKVCYIVYMGYFKSFIFLDILPNFFFCKIKMKNTKLRILLKLIKTN